jgi:hypothetical protein
MHKMAHRLQTSRLHGADAQRQQGGRIDQQCRIAAAMVKIGGEVQALHGLDWRDGRTIL